ncbi:hypothetical protein [Gracilimonas sp.]|uniref:hypothetical protein n=1 Tax=Gracilimonas sp. TaxID=1974203 RepID=UPI003D0F0684
MKITSITVAFFLLLTQNVFSQDNSSYFSVDTGVKYTDGKTGIGLSGKILFSVDRFLINVNPIDLNFIPTGPKDGFRNETLSDGREVCRNSSNGQFAKKENCTTQFDLIYGLAIDGGYNLNRESDTDFFVGAGFRTNSPTTPYITANLLYKPNKEFSSNPVNIFGKIAAGRKFFELSIGLFFPI